MIVQQKRLHTVKKNPTENCPLTVQVPQLYTAFYRPSAPCFGFTSSLTALLHLGYSRRKQLF